MVGADEFPQPRMGKGGGRWVIKGCRSRANVGGKEGELGELARLVVVKVWKRWRGCDGHEWVGTEGRRKRSTGKWKEREKRLALQKRAFWRVR